MNSEFTICRICGFNTGHPVWGKDGNLASFDICSCCGVTFGYQDGLQTAIDNYRAAWVQKGCVWFEPKAKPQNWSWENQKKQIPLQYR